MTLSHDMIARIAERRENEFAFAGPSVVGMTDQQVADLFAREDAEAAALKARDLAEEDAKLAALGLARGQVVRASGKGAHHDSLGAETVDLDEVEWRVAGIESDGAISLVPVAPGGHYALVRRDAILA